MQIEVCSVLLRIVCEVRGSIRSLTDDGLRGDAERCVGDDHVSANSASQLMGFIVSFDEVQMAFVSDMTLLYSTSEGNRC